MSEQKTIPWVPGMRATDADGRGWRRATSGDWVPDDGPTDTATPTGKLSPDFADLTTGVVVQWIVSQAQQQQAATEQQRLLAEEQATKGPDEDPQHPANLIAALTGETKPDEGAE